MGIGSLAVVLVALPYKVFDLDRYFVPKELVLHVTATLAAVGAIAALGIVVRRSVPTVPLTRVDTLLAAFLMLSSVSALFAPNSWLAARALAVSVSGAALFWVGQSLARAGRARSLMAMLAAAVTAASVTALLQAYGVETELFSLNRSPGGTLGNRNFVAHLAAIGLPTLVIVVLRARRALWVALGALSVAIVAAALVLSRSRGAWVATALAVLSIVPIAWRAGQSMRGEGRASNAGRASPAPRSSVGSAPGLALRSTLVVAAAVAGIGAAVGLPNTLNWRSPSPYLDSVLGVTNYHGGSGHGRVVQYANTARLALTHPVLGVGPGNWAVTYPGVAPRADPSLDPDDGMTANPWPSSDWAAFVSERGVPATVCLAFTLLGLVVAAGSAAGTAAIDGRIDRLLPALALTATVVAVVAVGAFDAVLLLPAPSLIAWSILGVLAGALIPAPTTRLNVRISTVTRWAATITVVVWGGLAAFRSASQVVAMAIYSTTPRTHASDRALELATRIDPGSYRIHMRLAEAYARGRSCGRARTHATAARALFPNAPEPRRLLAECGGSAVR